MITKKLKAMSLTLAAVTACAALPVYAEDIDVSAPDNVIDVRLTKPYLNFSVDRTEGVDVSEIDLALQDSEGNVIASFKGGDSELSVKGKHMFDFTNVHSSEDARVFGGVFNYQHICELFYPDETKSTKPWGRFFTPDKNIELDKVHDGGYYMTLYNDYYYHYTDKSKFDIVDNMTVPAGKMVVDVSSKYTDIQDKWTYFYLFPTHDGNRPKSEYDEKNHFNMYQHSGEMVTFDAEAGIYSIMAAGHSSGGVGGGVSDYDCRSYDRETSYVKVRMKFTDAFPGLFNDDLTFDVASSGREYHFDMRGDNSKNTISVIYYSGAVVSAPIPDDEGYVEFWVSEEELTLNMRYALNGNGFGRGGVEQTAKLPDTLEKINILFEYPRSGFCLYNLPEGEYSLVINDPIDSRDYFIAGPTTVAVTDTRDMQKASFTVDKKPLLLGDCNRDGIIDSADVVIIGAYIKGEGVLDGRGPVAADIDENGEVDIADVTALAAHVKGLFDIPKKYV